jgi:death-on-curing protein
MAPIWLERDVVVSLHADLVVTFGGLAGIRDEGLLESALARPPNLAAYGEPSLFELAAAYIFGLAKNHAFVDGNKRIAFVAADVFLQLNGFELTAAEPEAVIVIRDLAAGELGEAEIAAWIATRSQPLDAD